MNQKGSQMTLEHVEAELRSIEEQIRPLAKRLDHLNKEKRRLKSVAFIEANGVRREDVEMSFGKDKPYFLSISRFGQWLRWNSNRRFCEWNQQIYFTAEIVKGKIDWDSPGRVADLPD